MLRFGTIVMTAEDLPRARAFWSAALGLVDRRPPSDDWVILDPPDKGGWKGLGTSIGLSVNGYARTERPRLHLDLYADDQRAEIDRLVALGATEIPWPDRPEGADYVVLEDPEGNRFCVVDVSGG